MSGDYYFFYFSENKDELCTVSVEDFRFQIFSESALHLRY